MIKLFFYFIYILNLLISLSGCYSGDQTLIPQDPFLAEEVKTGYNIRIEPKVDILFIIDDSGSMSEEQTALAQNIDLFTASMDKNKFLDYQVGVISSSIGPTYSTRSGRLLGNPNIISRTTPNGISILPQTISSVGTSGDANEKFFDPVMAAVDPNLGLNPGFVRSDAFLVLIVIADAHDQSVMNSGFKVHDALVSLKADDTEKVLGYGVLSYPSFFGDTCGQDESVNNPINIFNFMGLFTNSQNSMIGGGASLVTGQNTVPTHFYELTNVFSLCDSEFGQKLANIGEDIRIRVSQKISLPVRPIDGTIRLMYGPQEIAEKWWKYDFGNNSIILDPNVELDESLTDAGLFVVMDQADPTKTVGKPID